MMTDEDDKYMDAAMMMMIIYMEIMSSQKSFDITIKDAINFNE